MVNRVSGEIHKKGGILQQTFGETVANAYGLVFYQAADGKLYRAQANTETTIAGVLYLCADAATVKTPSATRSRRDGPRRPVGHGPWENWSTSRRPWPAN